MKAIFSLILLSLFICCQPNQKITRKDAADVLNLMDSLTFTLRPPADDLTAYFKTVNELGNESNDYKLSTEQVDSLSRYYNDLMQVYDNALIKTTTYKTFEKFDTLQNSFIKLLDKGRDPWYTVFTVQIKMSRIGMSSLTAAEQKIMATAESIFKNGAALAVEMSKITAVIAEDIEKRYHVEMVNGVYH